MGSTSPAGRSILVVEDEPLIALDIEQTFAKAGAIVLPTRTLGDAHHLVEQNSLSAAVLDIRLCDGDSEALCARLVLHDIPFIIHSGYPQAAQPGAVAIPKPSPAASPSCRI
jgi:DNA-binding response OmpR family regulator